MNINPSVEIRIWNQAKLHAIIKHSIFVCADGMTRYVHEKRFEVSSSNGFEFSANNKNGTNTAQKTESSSQSEREQPCHCFHSYMLETRCGKSHQHGAKWKQPNVVSIHTY